MLDKRLWTAAVGIPLIIGLLAANTVGQLMDLPLLALVAGLAWLGCREYEALLKQKGYEPAASLPFMVASLPCALLYVYGRQLPNSILLLVTIAVVFAVLLIALALISEVSKRRAAPVIGFFLSCAGGIYIGGCLCFLLLLELPLMPSTPKGQLPDPRYHQIWPVVLLFLTTWALDTAAYAVGKLWGAHKLWPRVSPGKTVEGTVGGLLAAVIIAIFAMVGTAQASSFTNHPNPAVFDGIWQRIGVGGAMLIGIMIGVVGQVGDLIESAFKRWVGTKDSGDLLPGHGGILDRFDSLLLSAPALYFLLHYLVSR